MSDHDPTLREMPHANSVEIAVLSVMMKFRDEFENLRQDLTEDWFYSPAHRMIFRKLDEKPSLDLTLFVQNLHDDGDLDSVGGSAAVSNIYTYAPGPHHLKEHLRDLRDRYGRRKGIIALQNALSEAFDCSGGSQGTESFLEALGGPITAVFDIMSGSKPVKDLKALAKEFKEDFEKLVRGDTMPMGIPFGIPEIDHCLPGMHPQHYAIISGRSGSGKSTLACEILGNIATDGVPALYLILERTEKSAFQKAVIQQARIHHKAVTRPREYAKERGYSNPNKEDLKRIMTAFTRILDSNAHIRKPDNRRIGTIVAEIRRYVRNHGVKVVFVDHISLIRGKRERGDSQEAELRGISNTLQELAHELGITVVVLCQESVDGDTKGAKAIEEDADWWLSIVQERDRKKDTFGDHQHVLVSKDSHNGKVGERLPLILDKETLRFVHGFPAQKEERRRRV